MLSSFSRKRTQLASLACTQSRGLFYSNGQPYDKRWQNQFNHTYFAEPQVDDPIGRPKPEDNQEYGAFLGSFRSHFTRRFKNMWTLPWGRRHRLYSPFDLYLLPLSSVFFLQFWPLGLGFKMLALLPLGTLYCRVKDRSADPVFPETYLRDMIHNNPQLKQLFKVESMTTLDFEFEYIKGFPSAEEFPEFENKLFSRLTRILQY